MVIKNRFGLPLAQQQGGRSYQQGQKALKEAWQLMEG